MAILFSACSFNDDSNNPPDNNPQGENVILIYLLCIETAIPLYSNWLGIKKTRVAF